MLYNFVKLIDLLKYYNILFLSLLSSIYFLLVITEWRRYGLVVWLSTNRGIRGSTPGGSHFFRPFDLNLISDKYAWLFCQEGELPKLMSISLIASFSRLIASFVLFIIILCIIYRPGNSSRKIFLSWVINDFQTEGGIWIPSSFCFFFFFLFCLAKNNNIYKLLA